MNHEAKTYRIDTAFDGVPVTIYVRAFVVDGRVRAIRSYRALDTDAQEIVPTIDNGKATDTELDLLASEVKW